MSGIPLIVGIDPGTTSAYAAIDTEGNIVRIRSRKEMDLSAMIADVIHNGRPIIVSCDKKNPPSFVEKFCAQFGARLIHPKEDMKQADKRELVDGAPTENAHEFDSLAAAKMALREFRPLLTKIDNYCERNKVEKKIKNKIIEKVIKDEVGIKLAHDLLRKPKNKDIQIIKEIISEPLEEERKKLRNTEISDLYDKLKDHEKTILTLATTNKKIKNELSNERKKTEKLKQMLEHDVKKKSKELAGTSKKTLKTQKYLLDDKEKNLKDLKSQIKKMDLMLIKANDCIIVKKFKTLGIKEFDDTRKRLRLKEGDMIFIDKIDSGSDKSFERLKGKVDVIFYRGNLPRNYEKKPFIFIKLKGEHHDETDDLLMLKRTEFERYKKESDVLGSVVKSYQHERIKDF